MENSNEVLQYQLNCDKNDFLTQLEVIKQEGIYLIKKYSPTENTDLLKTYSLNRIVEEVRNLNLNLKKQNTI